jgi:NADPH:quinone reductase-like Zn-dependent oxidoreductase
MSSQSPNYFSRCNFPNLNRFETMNRAISLHQIQPVIDRVFPFTEAPAAYRHLQSSSHFGKVVIQV